MTSLREFDALAPAWRDVTAASGQTSPFLSHDWFACCWRTAGPNRRREVLVLEDTAGPVAFFPLVYTKTRLHGLHVRSLAFLASPDTPFADFPIAGDVDEAIARLLDALRARRDWDLLRLPKLRAHSPIVKALGSALSGAFPWRNAGRTVSPHIALTGSWDDFLREKSQRFRKTCRNVDNRLQRAGTIAIEEHRDVDPAGRLFAELMEVSRQSWKAPEGVAMTTMQG
ncbi:MAG: GNAT family N-acetyltransferase, partial [Candidatus Rokuibacteriota bacterium]